MQISCEVTSISVEQREENHSLRLKVATAGQPEGMKPMCVVA